MDIEADFEIEAGDNYTSYSNFSVPSDFINKHSNSNFINCQTITYTLFNYSSAVYKTPVWNELDYMAYIKIIIYSVVIIGGLLGNISVILTVACNKSMRTTINLYVANLAVADAMICIICMLPEVLEVLTPIYMLGEIMCKLNPFAEMTCLTCSVLTLSAISCDRFIAIMFPLHVRVTKQRTTVIITIVWIISILVSLPFLFFKKYVVTKWSNFIETQCNEEWPVYWYFDETLNTCANYSPHRTIYFIVATITLYFLPMLIMITAYTLILWRLRVSTIPGEQHESNTNIQSRAKKKVHKMVFVVLVAFIICWTPFHVLILYGLSRERARAGAMPTWSREFRWYAYFIAFANSFINPIIYGGYNESFRDGFCNLLRCKCQGREFGQSVRSRLTFTTGSKSSSSRKTLNGSNKVAVKPLVGMTPTRSHIQERVEPNLKEICITNL